MLTAKGHLIYGIEYPADSGSLHYDFELRLPTVGDNVAAIEAHGIKSNLKLNLEMMARSLLSLGEIPADKIDYALLADGLVDDDYDVLATVRDDLKKKRKTMNAVLTGSASPSSPSDATASTKAG